jgi:hypothetical protein
MPVLVLTNEEIRTLVPISAYVDAIETAREFGLGRAVTQPRTDLYGESTAENRYCVFKSMVGLLVKDHVVALRINSDVISWTQSPSRGSRARFSISSRPPRIQKLPDGAPMAAFRNRTCQGDGPICQRNPGRMRRFAYRCRLAQPKAARLAPKWASSQPLWICVEEGGRRCRMWRRLQHRVQLAAGTACAAITTPRSMIFCLLTDGRTRKPPTRLIPG